MKRILLFTIISVGCDIEQQDSGLLSLDPNYGSAPPGVSIEDVDLVKDGTIDIKDLTAVAYYFGEDVASYGVEAESCPAGQYRMPRLGLVGFNSYYRGNKIDSETGKYIKHLPEQDRPAITHPLTGRRLEDKYTESCEYLYPGIARERWDRLAGAPKPRDYPSDCLISCLTDRQDNYGRTIVSKDFLCRQKIIGYSDCLDCRWPLEEIVRVPIAFADFIQSDDPTKCARSQTITNKEYRFVAPIQEGEEEWLYDGGGYFHYALLRMAVAELPTGESHAHYLNYKLIGGSFVAIRFLVVANERGDSFSSGEPIVRQIKAKVLADNAPEKEIVWWLSHFSGSDHLHRAPSASSYAPGLVSAKSATSAAVALSLENHNEGGNHTIARVYSDFIPTSELTTPVAPHEGKFLNDQERASSLRRIQRAGIQIGEPVSERGLTNAVIHKIVLRTKNGLYNYQWRSSNNNAYERVFPAEVRERYFPEDIE